MAILLVIILLNTNCKKDEEDTSIKDYDGNVYTSVKIGNQEWLLQNLKTTHYNNGDPIPLVSNADEWASLTSGACFYDAGNNYNLFTYGIYYNWYAVDDIRGIAPKGWHVASRDEWTTLIEYLGGEQYAAYKLKEIGTTHWSTSDPEVTNQSGFTALPAGYYFGIIHDLNNAAYFWNSTPSSTTSNEAYYVFLYYYTGWAIRYICDKREGYSVRCVKN